MNGFFIVMLQKENGGSQNGNTMILQIGYQLVEIDPSGFFKQICLRFDADPDEIDYPCATESRFPV